MPYDILKLKKGQYEVVNTDTGEVHAKQTTLAKAKAQVRLLGMKHAKGGLTNPNFDENVFIINPNAPVIPNINQVIGLYETVRPLFNNEQFAEAIAELNAFDAEFDLEDDDVLDFFNNHSENNAFNVYDTISQMVIGAENLYDSGYRAPADINALDAFEMGEAMDNMGMNLNDDDQMEGNGYHRMKNGCSLYTGGSSDVDPINYNSELKNNSWLGYGYGGRSGVLPVNYNSEMTRSFNDF